MVKAGIIGSTGYAGQELVRLLLQHPEAEIVWYGSKSYIDKRYYEVFGNMFEIVDEKCMDDNMEELAEKADVISRRIFASRMFRCMKNGMGSSI